MHRNARGVMRGTPVQLAVEPDRLLDRLPSDLPPKTLPYRFSMNTDTQTTGRVQ